MTRKDLSLLIGTWFHPHGTSKMRLCSDFTWHYATSARGIYTYHRPRYYLHGTYAYDGDTLTLHTAFKGKGLSNAGPRERIPIKHVAWTRDAILELDHERLTLGEHVRHIDGEETVVADTSTYIRTRPKR